MSYDDICGKYNVSCSPKMYDKIIKYIPLQMINLVKEQIKYSTITPKMSDLMIENFNFTDKKCSNRFLRNCLIQSCFPGPVKRSYIFSHFDKKKVSEIRTNFLTFPVNRELFSLALNGGGRFLSPSSPLSSLLCSLVS